MPPHPRNRPALEAASPQDTRRPGDHGYRPGNRVPWMALFRGGQDDWRTVEVLGWWEDDLGRHVVMLEWRAEESTWSGSFLFNEDGLRDE